MAPTRDAPVVRRHPETGERRLDLLRWGLIPHWAKDPKAVRMSINARSETLATTPMFRDAYAQWPAVPGARPTRSMSGR